MEVNQRIRINLVNFVDFLVAVHGDDLIERKRNSGIKLTKFEIKTKVSNEIEEDDEPD